MRKILEKINYYKKNTEKNIDYKIKYQDEEIAIDNLLYRLEKAELKNDELSKEAYNLRHELYSLKDELRRQKINLINTDVFVIINVLKGCYNLLKRQEKTEKYIFTEQNMSERYERIYLLDIINKILRIED